MFIEIEKGLVINTSNISYVQKLYPDETLIVVDGRGINIHLAYDKVLELIYPTEYRKEVSEWRYGKNK